MILVPTVFISVQYNSDDMKGEILLIISLLSCCLSLQSQDSSKIFVSASTKGTLQNGVGIEITLTNVNSMRNYETKSLGLFSRYSYINNLPPGRYIVTEIEIPLGSISYINRSKGLTEYFDTLNIQPGSVNYLGNFHGYREVGDSAVFHLYIKTIKIPSKLIKKAFKKGLIPENVKSTKLYPYKKEELIIY